MTRSRSDEESARAQRARGWALKLAEEVRDDPELLRIALALIEQLAEKRAIRRRSV